MRENKKAAIEMSIGTIVTIVLSMSMLILGMVLIKNIFSGASNISDMSNDQVASEIAKLYGDDKKLVIYPSVDMFEITPGETSVFAIRIKNLLKNVDAANVAFSYDISFSDFEECGLSETQLFAWMKGESGSDILIASSGESIEKISISVPEGAPLCTFKLRVHVKQNGTPYDATQMFVEIVG